MQAPKTRSGWELSRSGGLAGTWNCGPMAVTQVRPGPRPSPSDVIAGMTVPVPRDSRAQTRRAEAGRDADRAVTALYLTHYRSLVKTAALLVRELTTAEEIVQDSFVAVHAAWRRLPDTDHALAYLRRSVVDRSRVALRQHTVVDKLAPRLAPEVPSDQGQPSIEVERSAFISALWTLPARQREVVVLRYFADLPETQVASATGISESAVKTHVARAMSALRTELHKAPSATATGPGDHRTAGAEPSS
jgi:RNA polymerase sigma-70 factor (sigma-E family)